MSNKSPVDEALNRVAATMRAAVMFGLALLFLLYTAVVIHLNESLQLTALQRQTLLWAFAVFWLLFIAESLLGFLTAKKYSWAALKRILLVWLLPPFRMTVSTNAPADCLWLPGWGWQWIGETLFERLERFFAMPMLIISLLVIPIIIVEFFFMDRVIESPWSYNLLNLGGALIWLAFTTEFVLMVSVTDTKFHYCRQNWINILIILLPIFAFLRSLRLLRAVKVAKSVKAGKLLRAYRLRNLITRAHRLALLFNLIERILHRDPQKYLLHLQGQVREKEQELAELRAKMRQLESQLQARDKTREHTSACPGAEKL